jgi:hypothetical protein
MKTKVLSVLLAISVFSVYAQIQKKKFIFSVTGGFADNAFNSGITTTSFNKVTRDFNLNFDAGFAFSNHLILGMGFGYEWMKENKQNIFYFGGYFNEEISQTKSNLYIPSIFLKYYIPITEKLIFTSSLNLGVGIIKSNEDKFSITNKYIPSDTLFGPIPYDNFGASKNNYKTDYTLKLIGIMPELVYYIKPKIGLFLQPGIFQCTLNEDWKPFWYLSVKPKDWNLGVQLCF